jgi:hypothetical protein
MAEKLFDTKSKILCITILLMLATLIIVVPYNQRRAQEREEACKKSVDVAACLNSKTE